MKIETKEKAPQQVALDELEAIARTPADQAEIIIWQEELDDARRGVLVDIGDTALPVLIELPDGSIVTEEERQKTISDGNASGPYDGRSRA